MRLPHSVFRDLLAEITCPGQRLVFLLAYGFLPESILDLARKGSMSRSAAHKWCSGLAKAGWLALDKSQPPAVRPIPLIPIHCQIKMAQALEEEYNLCAYRGEWLLKRFLDLWIFSDEFIDNARPDFLTSPLTDRPLEYDRYYYKERLAFEFNGPQHFGTTEQYSDKKAASDRRMRDIVKQGLSKEAKIELVVVTAEMLNPEILDKLIPSHIKRRPIDESGPYFQTLKRLMRAYSAKASSTK